MMWVQCNPWEECLIIRGSLWWVNHIKSVRITGLFLRVKPETKQKSSQWKNPQSLTQKKVCKVRRSTKSILLVFLWAVLHDFIPQGQAVNSADCGLLRHLRENILCNNLHCVAVVTALQHDNASAHSNDTVVAHQPLSHWPWPPVASLCSQKWSWSWRVAVVTLWRRSSTNRRWLLTHLQNGTSRRRFSHGRTAGNRVSLHKGATSKGIAARFKSGTAYAFYRHRLPTKVTRICWESGE